MAPQLIESFLNIYKKEDDRFVAFMSRRGMSDFLKDVVGEKSTLFFANEGGTNVIKPKNLPAGRVFLLLSVSISFFAHGVHLRCGYEFTSL